MTTINDEAIALHKQYNGKIKTALNIDIKSQHDLSLIYTPGVAAVSSLLQKEPDKTNLYTSKGRTVAVISDGSAVLGLGNIGPYGAWPVMEGKCALFTKFAGLSAVPILLNTQDPDEIIKIILSMAPSFGGINLEDIKAPGCFYIEEMLRSKLDIPVIHDDQWGAATVTLAGLINAAKVVNKNLSSLKVIINGAGAAAQATAQLLLFYGIKDITILDSQGVISSNSADSYKAKLAMLTNPRKLFGLLEEVIVDADIVIGLSKGEVITKDMVKSMANNAIIFALANPTPEIMPDIAKEAGAVIVATGRSDFDNQINNSLVFPGIFKGLLQSGKKQADNEIFVKAAEALANMIAEPTIHRIIPTVFEDTAGVVAEAVST